MGTIQKFKNWVDKNDSAPKFIILAMLIGIYLVTLVAINFMPVAIEKEVLQKITAQLSQEYSPVEMKQELQKRKSLLIKERRKEGVKFFSLFMGGLVFMFSLTMLNSGASDSRSPWERFK